MCMCGMMLWAQGWRSENTLQESFLSFFHVWILGTELRPSALAANILTCWASSLAHHTLPKFKNAWSIEWKCFEFSWIQSDSLPTWVLGRWNILNKIASMVPDTSYNLAVGNLPLSFSIGNKRVNSPNMSVSNNENVSLTFDLWRVEVPDHQITLYLVCLAWIPLFPNQPIIFPDFI